MVTYEITTEVRADLVPAYESYMRERHIPDLLATGYFVAASLARSSSGRYRARYEARDAAALDRYLEREAARLRAHFAERFPDGVVVSREVWTVLASWPPSGARATP